MNIYTYAIIITCLFILQTIGALFKVRRKPK